MPRHSQQAAQGFRDVDRLADDGLDHFVEFRRMCRGDDYPRVLAPFFRLFPTPATLLFFQALFAAVSVFPVVTVAFSLTTRGTGRLIGFAYAFSWGLQQMINFDFHEIALAVPLLAFSVSALARRRPASRNPGRRCSSTTSPKARWR